MKNFVQNGEILEVVAPYEVQSGGGVKVGSIFGFAVTYAAAGETVDIKRHGVFDHAKLPAQAWTQGAPIYWDDATKQLTTTSTSNLLVGAAAAAAANPSAVGRVVI